VSPSKKKLSQGWKGLKKKRINRVQKETISTPPLLYASPLIKASSGKKKKPGQKGGGLAVRKTPA